VSGETTRVKLVANQKDAGGRKDVFFDKEMPRHLARRCPQKRFGYEIEGGYSTQKKDEWRKLKAKKKKKKKGGVHLRVGTFGKGVLRQLGTQK